VVGRAPTPPPDVRRRGPPQLGPRPDDRRTAGRRNRSVAGHRPSTSTPGLSRPVGSKRIFNRRWSSVTAGSTERGGAGRSWCTIPTPTSATNRPDPTRVADLARRDRPAAARRQRRWRVAGHEPVRGGLLGDIVGMTAEQDPCEVAVPQDRHRPIQRAQQGVGTGGRGEPLLVRGDRAGPQDHVAEEAEGAPRPDEQAAQVEPTHVLDRGPAGLHDLAGGADVPRLQHGVAHRPVAEPAHAAAPDGERTADGTRSAGWPPSGRPRRARRRAPPRGCPRHTRTVISSARTTRSRRGHHGTHPVDRPAAGGETGDRHRTVAADLLGELGQIHAPSGAARG
jgi:hypothetical protein